MRKRYMNTLKNARKLLEGKENVLVFTGSGASQPSGLPTFTGPDALVDWGIDRWIEDPDWRKEVWEMMFVTFWDVEPNPAHESIDDFIWSDNGKHVTSNVDGLSMGLELCGSAQRIRCHDCNTFFHKDTVRERWFNEDPDPACTECEGPLRPDVVFIGEMFEMEALIEYDKVMESMDALVVVGASPLIGLWSPAVDHAQENDIPIVSINKAKKPWNNISTVHLRGDAAELTPQLLG